MPWREESSTGTAPGLYDTEDEADLHGLAYGQRIIDGRNGGLTCYELVLTSRHPVQFNATSKCRVGQKGGKTLLALMSLDKR